MPSQIFKTSPPIQTMFDFLASVGDCLKNKYIFSKAVFKKAQYEKKIQPFCDSVGVYYFKSKTFYTTRHINYKNFITILRQFCKHHHIGFTSEMQYNQSKYEIIYYIFIPAQLIAV